MKLSIKVRHPRHIIGLLLLVLTLAGCGKSKGGKDIVARAYGNYLYRADIEGLVADGTTPEDSVAIVSNYINQWLQQQVVLEQARKNVKKNFDKELQNYKNSLMAYEYEQLVVEQMLDTNVSDDEVAAYYESHQENFVLRSAIVRAIYVKLPHGAQEVGQLRKVMQKPTLSDDDLLAIQKIASVSGTGYDFDMECWRPLFRFFSDVPMETVPDEAALRGRRSVETDDGESIYLAHIFDVKGVGDPAPMEYERDAIKTIILNRRKIDIIKNMQRDLIKEADAKGEIEIK